MKKAVFLFYYLIFFLAIGYAQEKHLINLVLDLKPYYKAKREIQARVLINHISRTCIKADDSPYTRVYKEIQKQPNDTLIQIQLEIFVPEKYTVLEPSPFRYYPNPDEVRHVMVVSEKWAKEHGIKTSNRLTSSGKHKEAIDFITAILNESLYRNAKQEIELTQLLSDNYAANGAFEESFATLSGIHGNKLKSLKPNRQYEYFTDLFYKFKLSSFKDSGTYYSSFDSLAKVIVGNKSIYRKWNTLTTKLLALPLGKNVKAELFDDVHDDDICTVNQLRELNEKIFIKERLTDVVINPAWKYNIKEYDQFQKREKIDNLAYANKNTIDVLPFEVSKQVSNYNAMLLQEVVVKVLLKNPNIAVIDRSHDDAFLQELNFQKTEQFKPDELIARGRGLGLQRLMVGSASIIDIQTNDASLSRMYMVSISFSIQLIDVKEGNVMFSRVFNASNASYTKEGAIRNAIADAQDEIGIMVNQIYPPDLSIIRIEDRDKKGTPQSVLIAGQVSMLQTGMKIDVYEVNEFDANGKKIKSEKKVAGLKVNELQGEIAVCQVTDNAKELEDLLQPGKKLKLVVEWEGKKSIKNSFIYPKK